MEYLGVILAILGALFIIIAITIGAFIVHPILGFMFLGFFILVIGVAMYTNFEGM